MHRAYRVLTSVAVALLFAMSNTRADGLAGGSLPSRAPTFGFQVGIHVGERGRVDYSLNGIPLGSSNERMLMTCPPPPDGCARVVGIMLAAGVASVVFLKALSRAGER